MRLAGTLHRYIGTSEEAKPFVGQIRQEDGYVLTAADLPIGSTFYEEDTGWEYTYKGVERWELSPDSARTTLILAKLDDVIEVLRDELLPELRTANGHLQQGSKLEQSQALELGIG